MRFEPRPNRKGARPRVAKSIFDRVIVEAAREARVLEETVAAEVIIRGVIITGATARVCEDIVGMSTNESDAYGQRVCELNQISYGRKEP